MADKDRARRILFGIRDDTAQDDKAPPKLKDNTKHDPKPREAKRKGHAPRGLTVPALTPGGGAVTYQPFLNNRLRGFTMPQSVEEPGLTRDKGKTYADLSACFNDLAKDDMEK